METISSSVSSFKIHEILPKTHQFYHLKAPHFLPQPHPYISTTNTTIAGKPTTSISTKPTPSSHYKFIPSPIQTHRNAASGYAAALIDAALCSNSLDAIHKDVKRMSKWLQHNEMLKDMMADPSVKEGVKGRVMKELTEKAKFRPQMVALVKMLMAKNKSGMVAQVMEEFQRIYYQLNYTLRVVA